MHLYGLKKSNQINIVPADETEYSRLSPSLTASPLVPPPRGKNHYPEFCGVFFYIVLTYIVITKLYFAF